MTKAMRFLTRTCREQLSNTLPGSQTRTILALALFAAVQFADAIWTATGVSRFGLTIEANPLVASSIEW